MSVQWCVKKNKQQLRRAGYLVLNVSFFSLNVERKHTHTTHTHKCQYNRTKKKKTQCDLKQQTDTFCSAARLFLT